MIVGSIWGIWHLPLWFIVGESHQGFPFILFFIYTLFLSFVLGLLYRQTKSVGYCLLFHAFANLLNLYFVLKINVIFIIIFYWLFDFIRYWRVIELVRKSNFNFRLVYPLLKVTIG